MTYSIKDFHTKTLHEASTKMTLRVDNEDTGAHILVKGIHAKSVAQDRLDSQISFSIVADKLEGMSDDVERRIFERDEVESIKVQFASKLITGWSFKECFSSDDAFELLAENPGLSDSVISHASLNANYFTKK